MCLECVWRRGFNPRTNPSTGDEIVLTTQNLRFPTHESLTHLANLISYYPLHQYHPLPRTHAPKLSPRLLWVATTDPKSANQVPKQDGAVFNAVHSSPGPIHPLSHVFLFRY
ncbi:hypothetical protein PCANC_17727 [Puccinia coronata f. sp. avenae]|uniref:Uncharacterized protein n=1 Tax=Puccinia coronata f. sp. avenae TaxID=200324 RepID=A0A2N5SFR8_9BASI|nr:hypothetical protein PCANC_17659 [Puccinia coronata f. sp. avenae]PLW31369.1 hypothetical protein PCANC_17727 [Puccinia coronata f. sp. avenae]